MPCKVMLMCSCEASACTHNVHMILSYARTESANMQNIQGKQKHTAWFLVANMTVFDIKHGIKTIITQT